MSRLRACLTALGALAVGCGGPTAGASCGGEGVICPFMGTGEAGLGEDGAEPLQVALYLPQDVSFGPDGRSYVIDWNNHRVRTIADGKVETVIGTGELGDATDGPATEVSLNHPTHVAFEDEDRLILSAWHNSKVMRYDDVTGELSTLCGDGRRSYAGDGGPGEDAVLDLPVATAIDDRGRMLIMDQGNQRIRRVERDGTIDTVVGPDAAFLPVPDGYERVCTTDDQGVESCKLCLPEEASDADCDPKRPQGFAGDGGPGAEAVMFQPFSQSAAPTGRMELGPDGILYFCDTGNHRVRALARDGTVDTVAGSGPEPFDRSFAGGYEGDGGPATEALLKRPTDVAVGERGELYIADTANSCVRRVGAAGNIETIAGVCGEPGYGGDGGPADEALLNRPYGVALDGKGNLYIADTHNHVVRVVEVGGAAGVQGRN